MNVRKSAQVKGNITSPRVSLEDGAKFKGAIEMDPQAAQNVVGNRAAPQKSASPPPQAAAKPVVQPAKPEQPAVVKSGAVS